MRVGDIVGSSFVLRGAVLKNKQPRLIFFFFDAFSALAEQSFPSATHDE